ncbi:FMN-binding protein [Paenibacillus timonensis]|uniref:FMN-binding protein n=1 Tax=Paenibacillus timonensis TaxID=225915 RepID=A0ABW3S9S3_9BACL|nr:FMN-binding protein [Paenibacillus timonensis]MCH1639370.1 FMN-binding protein [Paenibacillus timonensis]
MKKLISLTVSATLVLSSLSLTVGTSGYKLTGIDVVSAASESETPAKESTPSKTTTPSKSTTPSKTTTKTPSKTTTKTPSKTTTPAKTTTKTTTPAKTTTKPATPAKTTTPVVKQVESPYADGVYVTYGNAYSKGTEGAKVTIKDGKVAAIELLRTSPKLIDRDARNNYSGLWNAYETMKANLLGKTKEQAANVDIVSGATRSSNGWKLSVDRAFQRALKEKPKGVTYFAGEHMGVDPEGKYMVFVTFDATKRTAVKVYPLDASGNAIEEANLTEEQAASAKAIAAELLAKGTGAVAPKGQEAEYKAAVNAYWDAEQNAKINNGAKYVDGFYSAYGAARDKGVERADVYIRNGKLVDVKLYRLGSNLIDRGESAYAEVVKANAPMTAKLLANGSYIANYSDDVDAIAGATESSHSWNLAVERAFEKALKVPGKAKYFEGTFAGVDNLSKLLVLADMKADKVSNVNVMLFGADGKLIAADKLTDEQKTVVVQLNEGLTQKGANMTPIVGQEDLSIAARAAFADLLNNASKAQGAYKDGTYTTFGDAYDKGTNRADVTLRNGVIVGLKLYRVGVNMVDRGASAYAEVVRAIPILTRDLLFAGTREQAAKVDVVTGATSSSTALKTAVENAYKKAEINESYKTAYINGIFAGINKDKSVYVMVTVQNNIPFKMEVFYLDANGKIKTEQQLTADEKTVKTEIETPTTEGSLHKYGYRPAAFGETDGVKAVSAQVVDAVKNALENAGR